MASVVLTHFLEAYFIRSSVPFSTLSRVLLPPGVQRLAWPLLAGQRGGGTLMREDWFFLEV